MPEWLAFAAAIGGWGTPSSHERFSWCELGCGKALSATIVAATHPEADVHAVDAQPEHVAHAEALRVRAGIRNLSLHRALFGAPELRALPAFDYIVAHGVYSWVGPAARTALVAFIDQHLKPGGLVYLSYNAMPGWAADLPLQRLLLELASAASGDSNARFAEAAAVTQRMTNAGASALRASPLANGKLAKRLTMIPAPYFAHEFLPAGWEALYVTDVRRDLAPWGLEPVASALIVNNFDAYTLRRREREALATVADTDLRELLRDYFRFARFRRDVFGRVGRRLNDAERRARLLETTYHLAAPPQAMTYRMTTPAGEVGFDTPIAHRIVDALAGGPRRLSDVAIPGCSAQDVLANALALCAANAIRPVSARAADVSRLIAALPADVEGGGPDLFRLSSFGTAFYAGATRQDARDGVATVGAAAWDRFLAACDVDAHRRQ
jgi:SAM-dependent methyltransferase